MYYKSDRLLTGKTYTLDELVLSMCQLTLAASTAAIWRRVALSRWCMTLAIVMAAHAA